MEQKPGPDNWIAHVDLDAFFASCEQRDHPEYRNKPVVVGALPGGRGVVAAASYEARAYGIHSAMPIGEAYRRCPHGIYLRPDFKKYSEASRKTFASLEEVTPAIEKASIDEAYLDVSGLRKLHGSPRKIGKLIKQRIHAATHLSASVGVAPNRLLAKLASEHNKPNGLVIVQPDKALEFLSPMPVDNLRGNGKVTQKIFKKMQIATIGQLRHADRQYLIDHLGQRAANHFLRQANGIAPNHVRTGGQRKSVSKERTFATDQSDTQFLRAKVQELSRGVAAAARRDGLAGRVIKLKIRLHDFTTLTRQQTLENGTDDERIVYKIAWQLYTRDDVPKKPVRLIGVVLSHWEGKFDAIKQHELFAPEQQAGSGSELLQTIDKVTERFGDGKLQIGLAREQAPGLKKTDDT